MELITVDKLNKKILDEMVKNIVQAVDPQKIILFGSYAYGKPTQDSDVDLLVIVDDISTTRRDLRLKIRKALRRFLISKDIIVLTSNDLKNLSKEKNSFIITILEKGKVLYERK